MADFHCLPNLPIKGTSAEFYLSHHIAVKNLVKLVWVGLLHVLSHVAIGSQAEGICSMWLLHTPVMDRVERQLNESFEI